MILRFLEWDLRLSVRLRVAEKPGTLRSVAVFFAHSGDSWFWLFGLGLTWLVGTESWRPKALVLIGGILITAVVVLLMKFTFRRQRPKGEWGVIYRKTDPHSFPSGHAARAFLLPLLASVTGPTWFYAVLIFWAPLVALARVAMGVHYVSDIIAGFLVGILMGIATLRIAIGLSII